MPNYAVILLGAGSSSRMKGHIDDKILTYVLEKPLFSYALIAFKESKISTHYTLVYRDYAQKDAMETWINGNIKNSLNIQWVQGGLKRQDSVINALEALPTSIDYVFIHDCARPLIAINSIIKVKEALTTSDAAILAHKVTDTIKQIHPQNSKFLNDLNRNTLWAMETPQTFKRSLILDCYKKAQAEGLTLTDDSAAVSAFGNPVTIVENTTLNPKVTYPEDLTFIETLLNNNTYAKL